ncbi:MAG: EamA family transporter [Calditrichaeota bacterium]|nr:MAG: EamA family transporter [Calditrichota bacterium]
MLSAGLLLSVATGILFGLQTIALKHTSSGRNQSPVLAVMFLSASVAFTPFIREMRINDTPAFLLWLGLSLSLNIIAFTLLFSALKHAPVSLVSPFLNLTPLFIILTGRLVVHESLNNQQVFGIVMIVLGAVMIQFRETGRAIRKRLLTHNLKYMIKAVIVALIWSFTAPIEKRALQVSTVYTYGFFILFALGIAFLFLGWTRGEIKRYRLPVKKAWLVPGIITGLMAITQYQAVLLQKVGPVIAYKRAVMPVPSRLPSRICPPRQFAVHGDDR